VFVYTQISRKRARVQHRPTFVSRTPDQVLEQNDVQIVDLEGTVLAVAKINGIVKAGDRYAIEGDPLPNDPRIGKPTTTPHRSRNSVGYF